MADLAITGRRPCQGKKIGLLIVAVQLYPESISNDGGQEVAKSLYPPLRPSSFNSPKDSPSRFQSAASLVNAILQRPSIDMKREPEFVLIAAMAYQDDTDRDWSSWPEALRGRTYPPSLARNQYPADLKPGPSCSASSLVQQWQREVILPYLGRRKNEAVTNRACGKVG